MADHQDHPNHALYRFSAGDMIALLDLIPCDEMDTLTVPGQGSITLARCGRVHIMASTEGGRLDAHAHNNAEEAADCYRFALTHFRHMIDAGPGDDTLPPGMVDRMPPAVREAVQQAMADGRRVRTRPATSADLPPGVQAAIDQLQASLPPGAGLSLRPQIVEIEADRDGMEGGYL